MRSTSPTPAAVIMEAAAIKALRGRSQTPITAAPAPTSDVAPKRRNESAAHRSASAVVTSMHARPEMTNALATKATAPNTPSARAAFCIARRIDLRNPNLGGTRRLAQALKSEYRTRTSDKYQPFEHERDWNR